MESSIEKKPIVLALDDSALILESIKSALDDEFEVHTSRDFSGFFRILEEVEPDVILLDILMPEGSGLDICQEIGHVTGNKEIPIIIMTGIEDEVTEVEGFKAGAVDYIRKPFQIPVLKARVRTHSELKLTRDHLRNLSSVDSLTGARNKRAFSDELRIAWLKGLRSKNPLSLMILDIDHFKAYNDHYGHLQGDECLRKVAQGISKSLPGNCSFYRFGGEEFVVLAPDTPEQSAVGIASSIQDALGALNLIHEKSSTAARITVSIGVATTIARSSHMPDDLLELADKALYRAKENGRNRVEHSFLAS